MAHKHIVYMMLVEAATMAKDEGAIRMYASVLQDLAERDDHRPYLAVAHRSWGVAYRLAGKHEEAEERLRKALDLFRELDSRWQVGRTLFELGELALARSDIKLAGEYFTQALGAFEQIKAELNSTQTKAAIAMLALS